MNCVFYFYFFMYFFYRNWIEKNYLYLLENDFKTVQRICLNRDSKQMYVRTYVVLKKKFNNLRILCDL